MTALQFLRWFLICFGIGIGVILFGITIGTGMGLFILWLGPVLAPVLPAPLAAEIAACDRAVHALLTTDNMVELERSKYLIRKLNCGVRRRLPPVGDAP